MTVGDDAGTAVDAAWRDHWVRLLALLTARFERVDLAEDALAEAFESATRTWPRDGIPASPAAWLHTTAQHRVVDRLRSEASAHRAASRIADHLAMRAQEPEPRLEPVPDEMLRLVFWACHPAVPVHAQAALALRWVLGVPTERIAILFAVSPSAMAARMTRARQRAVAAPGVFRIPSAEHLPERLAGVLRAIHLFFTLGYAPEDGDEVVRAEVCAEAIRLAAVVDRLLPGRTDVQALRSLLELQHARRDARNDAAGNLVLLADQDRRLWRADEMTVALRRVLALDPSRGLAEELRLQALIAAVHTLAPDAGATDWRLALTFYDRLLELSRDDPVVRLNRAVAIGEVAGPQAALESVRDLRMDHHRAAGVLADLFGRCGRWREAAERYRTAVDWCGNDPVRRHYEHRLADAVAKITLA